MPRQYHRPNGFGHYFDKPTGDFGAQSQNTQGSTGNQNGRSTHGTSSTNGSTAANGTNSATGNTTDTPSNATNGLA